MKRYRLLNKKGEGTFSEVLKAQSIKTGRYVAVKCMKAKFTSLEQVNNLREIQALRRLSPHPNIVGLIEVLFDKTGGRLALVFELMSLNLYELIRGRRRHLASGLIKVYMFQTLRALAHMHEKGVMHRDIKPENVLVESSYDVYSGLKLADFGSCRGIYSRQPYTEYISTRWYRAPECLLTDGYYGREMDVWGVGAVFYELCALRPLFPGENEKDMVRRVHEVLGTPTDKTLQYFKRHASRHMDLNFAPVRGKGLASMIPGHVPVQMVDLLLKMLQYDPRRRITAKEALLHPYFADLRKTEVPNELQSKFPAAFTTPEVQPKSASSGGIRAGSGKRSTVKSSAGGSSSDKAGQAAADTATGAAINATTGTGAGGSKEGSVTTTKSHGSGASGGTTGGRATTGASSSGAGSTAAAVSAKQRHLEEQAKRRQRAAQKKLAREAEAAAKVVAAHRSAAASGAAHPVEEEGVDAGSPDDRARRSQRLYDGKVAVQPQTLRSTGQTSLFAAAAQRRGSVGDAAEVIDEVSEAASRQASDRHTGSGAGSGNAGSSAVGSSPGYSALGGSGSGSGPAVTRRPRGLRRRYGAGGGVTSIGGGTTGVGGGGADGAGAGIALSPSTTRTVAGNNSLRQAAAASSAVLSHSTSRIQSGARPLYGVSGIGAGGGGGAGTSAAHLQVMGGGAGRQGTHRGSGDSRRSSGKPYLGGAGNSAARRAARYGGVSGHPVTGARRRQGALGAYGGVGSGVSANGGVGGFSYGGGTRAVGAGWRRR